MTICSSALWFSGVGMMSVNISLDVLCSGQFCCLTSTVPGTDRLRSKPHNTLSSYFAVKDNNNNHFLALCLGLPGWASTRRNTHPPTILIIIQSLSASSIYHDPLHPLCSNYVLGNLFAQPLSMSSLVYLLVWSPPPHISYISSPNQCLLFAAHAHTITTCFAVVSIQGPSLQNGSSVLGVVYWEWCIML